jgi:hypothetical protein
VICFGYVSAFCNNTISLWWKLRNINDVPIENILPFAFPFGIGGPKMKRRTQVSLELCIQLYLRLSLKQFMEGPTILVLNHIYNRQMSYMSGVMTCRSTVNGVSLGDRLSRLTIEDLQLVTNENTKKTQRKHKRVIKSNFYIMQNHGTH